MRRGSVAGLAAAGVWAAAEPLASRAAGISWYSDVRLLGRVLVRGERWRLAGLAAHLANGAAFGALFDRLGWRGPLRGVAAAEAENVLLWPVIAAFDRVHPERRSGVWPPLATNARVGAYEAGVHALFGLVLGTLLPRGR